MISFDHLGSFGFPVGDMRPPPVCTRPELRARSIRRSRNIIKWPRNDCRGVAAFLRSTPRRGRPRSGSGGRGSTGAGLVQLEQALEDLVVGQIGRPAVSRGERLVQPPIAWSSEAGAGCRGWSASASSVLRALSSSAAYDPDGPALPPGRAPPDPAGSATPPLVQPPGRRCDPLRPRVVGIRGPPSNVGPRVRSGRKEAPTPLPTRGTGPSPRMTAREARGDGW